MKITFHGAAGDVTGSKHLLECSGKKLLIDCGFFQGPASEEYFLNKNIPFDASSIDAVIITHAHIDHSGLLPLLVKKGFRGKIFTSPATAALLKPLWLDAVEILSKDAYYRRLHRKEDGNKLLYTTEDDEPLYTEDDVEKTTRLFSTHEYRDLFSPLPGITAEFYNAGHILGSAQVLITSEEKKVFFTGDLGSRDRKILKDPEHPPYADIMITESTYGARFHKNMDHTRDELADVIRETYSKNGKLIIPSFALERTQELLYDLHRLFDLKQIPEIPVFLDSPLAIDFTKIFNQFISHFDEETHDFFLDKKENPFIFRRLTQLYTKEESKKLNTYNKPCIVIAGSGMMQAGRIRHHLLHQLPDSKNTLLIVGYQAQYTLGRSIVDGAKTIELSHQTIPVRARIVTIGGYSAHGDQTELKANILGVHGIKKLFIVHGELTQMRIFSDLMQKEKPGLEIIIPKLNDTFDM